MLPPFLIGVLRILQGLQNNKPIAYLIMEIALLLLLSWVIKNACTDKAFINGIVKKKLEQASLSSLGLQQYETILRDFSKNGATAISGFSEFAVLASIFAVYSPVAWGSRSGYVDSGSSSSCSSGSSCGGSSCSSGCGGCGGGD